jgi:hypothetical protein
VEEHIQFILKHLQSSITFGKHLILAWQIILSWLSAILAVLWSTVIQENHRGLNEEHLPCSKDGEAKERESRLEASSLSQNLNFS